MFFTCNELIFFEIFFFQVMKLRSHEILSHPQMTYSPKPSSSRLKKFFQGKHLFKKKLPISSNTNAQPGLFQHIPNYVRKSLLRYLLEVWYRLIRNIMLTIATRQKNQLLNVFSIHSHEYLLKILLRWQLMLIRLIINCEIDWPCWAFSNIKTTCLN